MRRRSGCEGELSVWCGALRDHRIFHSGRSLPLFDMQEVARMAAGVWILMATPSDAKFVAAYDVQARNLSHASENKIHDDGVAREFGFQGALVPGVEVYAYMAHLPVARWGVDWLERGTAECRFLKPVYDGKFVSARATEGEATLSITLESEGELCATGGAALPQARGAAPGIPDAVPIPEPDERPDADEESLATGRRMSSPALHLTPEYLQQYLASIRETESLYL